MKKLLTILLAAAIFSMIFVLGGYGKDAADKTSAADESKPVGAEPSIEDARPVVPVSTLYFKGAPERSDGDYTKVYEINCGGEYLENSYVWCDSEMTGFECVPVEMNDDGSFTRTGSYARIDSVKPGEAVYVIIELPEVIPNAAFVYTAGGTEYVWLIGYNGRDGGMSLSPLDPGQLHAE